MYSRFLRMATAALVCTAPGAVPGVMRVCADPNNLPFSNRAGEGFENRIASLMASELHATVAYTWCPQRRGPYDRSHLKIGVHVGYSSYGDYSQANPPAGLVDAVEKGDVDTPPLTYEIAVGPRKRDIARRDQLQRILDRRRNGIDKRLQGEGK
jgi:hypothetical protein